MPGNGWKPIPLGETLQDWSELSPRAGFKLADALTGCIIFGATGSGKTSGPGKHIAMAYLARGFGGLVLCAKPTERAQWQEWARAAGRERDLVIVDVSAVWRFNFLNWQAQRPSDEGGLALNIVALLDEIAEAVAGSGKSEGGDGENQFFKDALHLMLLSAVQLLMLAGYEPSLPTLRLVVTEAPQSTEQVRDAKWREESACARLLAEADARTAGDEEARAEFEEVRAYWEVDFPQTSEKTRGIILICFSIVLRPFLTRPLRKLFCSDTNIVPENTFDGRIIIIDLPVQSMDMAGRVAAMAWKFCFQKAMLRRHVDENTRCVFLWADECQQFVSKFDSEYQAVARSAYGCTVYLTQNRSMMRMMMGSDDRVDALLGNLQNKFFCQNSGETNEWAAKLLGEHWVEATSVGTNAPSEGETGSSFNTSERRQFFVEPATFATLRRGGTNNRYRVDAVVYLGGYQFRTPSTNEGTERLPYCRLTFDQRQ